MGVDEEKLLIQLGIEKELGAGVYEEKRPEFLVSSSFEFEKLSHSPDFALAVSLFTHLPGNLIRDCLRKLRKKIRNDGVFFASFVESDRPGRNPSAPHPHRSFCYSNDQMLDYGRETGWAGEIGGMLKPGTGQRIIKYLPC
jgi:hypothetical protein